MRIFRGEDMKNLLKSVLFLFILFILVEASIIILTPKSDSDKYSFLERAEYEILQEKKETVDVLAFGDSLIYSSINPLIIWNDYGYTVFDVAEPAYIMSDAYKQLEAAIDYHKPKMVIMEGNMLFRNPKNYPWYDKLAKKIGNMVPINKYHNNWKNLITNKQAGSKSLKGYKFITKVVPSKNYDYMEYSKDVRKFPDKNIDWFKKMLELCKKKDIQFLLVSTPSQVSANFPRRTALVRLSNELDFDYVDLNLGNPLNIDWTKETKDEGGHLNYLGAEKVSKYLGKYLKEKAKLVDHRSDKKYASWNDAYNEYKKEYDAIVG